MKAFDRIPRRVLGAGIVLGALYGIVCRAAAQIGGMENVIGVMTVGFLFIVPVVVGFLTVYPAERPSLAFSLFAPWVPSALIVLIAAALGWEGAICIVMASPVLLLFSSIGGGVAMLMSSRARRAALPVLLVLPWLTSPLERHVSRPTRFTATETSILVHAPLATLWPLVVSVDSIRPREEGRALFTTMGFPHPISAVLDHPGVGGVRTARFTGGLVFTERVSQWEDQHLIRFSIRANTDSIPAKTLDPHVTIGGPYFDVLTGTYELRFVNANTTRLVLRSEHRETTPFNLYAGWWADIVMRSIQQNILEVIRARAERTSRRGARFVEAGGPAAGQPFPKSSGE